MEGHSHRTSVSMGGSSPADLEKRRNTLGNLVVAAGAAIASFAVYLATLQPGFGGSGDSQLFQLLAALPGTTNYPTHLIALEAMKTALPFVDPAFRANLLSAGAAAAACAVMVLVLRRLGTRRTAAAGAALAFAWTSTLWSQAIVAEVYTLNVLFVLTVILLLLLWRDSRRRHWLTLALAVLAIGLGCHNTMALVIPGTMVFLWRVDRSVFRHPWFVVSVTGAISLAVLPYGLVVWRTFDPDVVFLGATAGNLGQLIDVMLGGGANRANLFQQPLAAVLTQRLPGMAIRFAAQLHLLLPFALIGGWRRPSAAGALLLTTLVCNLLLLASYSVPDLAVFYLPAYAMVAVFAGFGLEIVLRRLGSKPIMALGLAGALPLPFLLANWGPTVATHDTATSGWTQRVLSATRSPGLFVALNWDMTNALGWATRVGNARTGQQRVLFYPWRAVATDIGLEGVRRHLCGGPPLRLQPRGRTVSSSYPVYLAVRRPGVLARLRQRGFELRQVERDVYELGAMDCRPAPLPAVVLVHEVDVRRDFTSAIRAVEAEGFDARTRVVVRGRPTGVERLGNPSSRDLVRVVEWNDVRIELEVSTAEPAWLVITDHVPRFWWAWIDGEGVATRDANVIHRGLPVPAGDHVVELRDPACQFQLGAWLTGRPAPLHP